MKAIQLLTIILVSINCSICFSQNNESLKEIEYYASTRGSSISITINQNKAIFNTKTYKVNSKKWNSIVSLISKINLKNLQNLQAPSEKRHIDAALAAEIKITTSENIFTSSQFDHGNPPEEIAKLIDKILKLVSL